MIVQVQGPRPENVIFLVHEVFEGLIAESFRGVTYDYLIPCPDCLRMVCLDRTSFCALYLQVNFLLPVKSKVKVRCYKILLQKSQHVTPTC